MKADVLVLLPTTVQAPFSQGLMSALSQRLNDTAPDVRLHVEVLPDGLEDERLLPWVEQRLKDQHFDVVLDVKPVAATFARHQRALPWSGATAVAVGLGCAAAGRSLDGINQICFEDSPQTNLSLIFALLPQTRHIVLIGFQHDLAGYPGWPAAAHSAGHPGVDIVDLRGRSLAELRDAVARLPRHSVLLVHGPVLDSKQRPIFANRLLTELQAVGKAPIFTNLMPQVGRGVVGGAVLDTDVLGRMAADTVLHKLLGQAVPEVQQVLMPLRVDWRQLQQHGLDEAALPASTEVLYREASAWQRYRWPIVLTGLVLLLYSMLLVRLLLERRRRRVAELQAHRRLAELAHVNRVGTVSQLSLSLAHEINQPLCTILSSAQTCEVLLDQPQPSQHELRRLLRRIVEADTLASRIVSNLRSLSQKDSREQVSIHVDGWVKDTARLLAPDAQLRGVSLALDLRAPQAQLMGDRVQLQQVLINLIINAMEAMQGTEVGVKHLLLSTRHLTGGQVQICIDDCGPGLPAQAPESVFEPFFSTKHHGLGLGLGIARELVQAHGGLLRAENLPEGGARFELVLPERVHTRGATPYA